MPISELKKVKDTNYTDKIICYEFPGKKSLDDFDEKEVRNIILLEILRINLDAGVQFHPIIDTEIEGKKAKMISFDIFVEEPSVHYFIREHLDDIMHDSKSVLRRSPYLRHYLDETTSYQASEAAPVDKRCLECHSFVIPKGRPSNFFKACGEIVADPTPEPLCNKHTWQKKAGR